MVDMFSPQGFHENLESKNGLPNLKRTNSPKIGILGSNTFSQDASGGQGPRKLDGQPSNTINKTIRSIEE